MPSPAVQTPFHPTAAKRKSRRVYVKQVLPFGTVEHPVAGTLDFTPDLVGEMVETFKQGAMTQVPFVLCDDKNRHPGEGPDSGDPERFRGEVTGLEQRDDGLYARVEMTERGAALLEDNPTQPVSIRMFRPTTGKFAGKTVLGHVAATLDEVAKNMHPWEQIDASSVSELTDLSDGTLTLADAGHGRPAGEMAETETTTLTDEDNGVLKRFVDRLKARGSESEEGAELSDEKVDEILAEVLSDAEEATSEAAETENESETEEQEAEVAALSDEDREALDLANSRAEQASKDAAAARAEADAQRFERESAEMKRAGIPPAAVDLARPVLEHGLPEQIDLSNGQKVDAAKIIRGLLKQMEGTIDFSELGAAEASDDDVVAEQRRKDAEAAAKGWV